MNEIADDPRPSARARRPVSSRVRVARGALARVAAWPIETLAPFAALELAALVREVKAAERVLRDGSARLLEELYESVSKASDARARAWLLSVKREVFNGTRPWREPPAREAEILAAASPGLAARLKSERAGRLRLLDLRARLAEAYTSELSAQRLALQREADGARFARSLALANPPLAERWRRRPREARRTKRARHLEGAVLHYLLRAVGRTTPSGDWAGVAPVRLSDGVRGVEAARASALTAATPDLLPFRQVVEFLAQTPRYLDGYPLRLDPAAHRDGEQWWGLDGEGAWRVVSSDAAVTLITDNFADGAPRPAPPLIEFLAGRSDDPDRVRGWLEAAVERLLAVGVLRSSLEFPAAPSSPWAALDAVTPALLEPERSAWAQAVERCRGSCAELAARYDELAPESLAQVIEEARAAVGNLCRRVGVGVQVPAQFIKLDRSAPFEISWSPRAMSELREAVVEVLACHAEAGGAETFRRELLRGSGGTCRTLAEAVRVEDDLRGRATRAGLAAFAEWARRRGPAGGGPAARCDSPLDAARPGPYGTLMFLLVGREPATYFTWGRPSPDFASCRAHQLLARAGHDFTPVGSLHDGVEPFEVVGIDAPNPNAAVRPALTGAGQIGRHGATAECFANLLLEVDADCRPWLRRAAEDVRRVPIYSVAAGVGVSDRAGRFLVRLAMAHGWEFLSFGVPFAAAAETEDAEPVEVFEGGSVLGLRQWLLPADLVERLRRESGLGQYVEWRALIDSLGVGGWVWLGAATPPDAHRVLVRTDSPLIVEAVLNRLEPECGPLLLSELPGEPADWPVRDAEGRHYLCELAVNWIDPEHWREVSSW